MINEGPNIVSTVSSHDGYVARGLCLVDGFPSEIRIKVDIRHQEYSTYEIVVFNPISMSWDQVYELNYDDIGHMPMIGDDPDTLIELNTVAQLLWQTANVVMTSARVRQDHLDIELHVRKSVALENSRRDADAVWKAPEISQGEFVLHGEVVEE